MKKGNFKKTKNIFLTIIFMILLVTFFLLLIITRDNKFIKNIKEYINSDTKILYISDADNYYDYPIEIFKKYDLNYMYVDIKNLSTIEKSKIQDLVNSKNLNNLIVIFTKGKIVDILAKSNDKEKLNKFLQKNKLIPDIIGDNSSIISNINELISTDYTILYLPYKYNDKIEKQDKILNELCIEYGCKYSFIKTYLLSTNQQEKLNSLLQISSVDNQIIILIKNNQIIGSIRDILTKKEYLDKFKELNFINDIDTYIHDLDYNNYIDMIKSNKKNIIMIGKDNCKYCDDVLIQLNNIAINYDIEINYINIVSMDSGQSNKIEKQLKILGYNDGFTTPLTIIVENNKLLDYVIGPSSEKYFIDIFKENGIIK